MVQQEKAWKNVCIDACIYKEVPSYVLDFIKKDIS